MTAQSMSLMMNSLADLDHPENLNLELQTGKPDDLCSGSISSVSALFETSP